LHAQPFPTERVPAFEDEAQNTDTEFNQQSGAICAACGFGGNLGDFKVEN
jgi:hypothetical protein